MTADHLGSPRVITNQNGAVTSRKDFTAFGEENFTAQRTENLGYTSQSETRKGYTGYEKDDESGLDFAQARYYNSGHGRFTSVDPLTASASIKDPQTFNRYSYVLNSPYKFTDPLGLIPESTVACGSRCPNSGPSVDGSAFRGRDASFDWAVFEVQIPNIIATSRRSDGTSGQLEAGHRKALQRSLSRIAPGTRVTADGRIFVQTGGSNLAGARLLNGIMREGQRTEIQVNNDGVNGRVGMMSPEELMTTGTIFDRTSLIFWDPTKGSPVGWQKSAAHQVVDGGASAEVRLAHELIHAYNTARGDFFLGLPITHTFWVWNVEYQEETNRSEMRAVGFGPNEPGDITENDIRDQLGQGRRISYTPKAFWKPAPKSPPPPPIRINR